MSISDVLGAALEKIQHISKTDTVFGEPIKAGDITLIPVSKVSIGFAAGGSDEKLQKFGGNGAGGGVTVTPVAFLSVRGDKVDVIPIDKDDNALGDLLKKAPEVIKTVSKFLNKDNKKEGKDK